MSRDTVSDAESRTGLARRRLDSTPRDEMGFLEGGISLSYKQIKWIILRLEVELDSDADERAEIDPTERHLWQKSAEFRAVYEACQDNKREAFRLLGTQMLPKALRVIDQLLDSPSPRAQAQGLNFLLRTQGMMVDKQPKTDPNELAAILTALRASNPPQFVAYPAGQHGENTPPGLGAPSLGAEHSSGAAVTSEADHGTKARANQNHTDLSPVTPDDTGDGAPDAVGDLAGGFRAHGAVEQG